MPARTSVVAAAFLLTITVATVTSQAQPLARGEIIDAVKCAADPAQSYALYIPSTYSPDRTWNLLIGFHPGARGRAMVETYRAAAETYGYIVAGSNNSRNGPWEISAASVKAMLTDLGQRLSVDPNRLYMTGLSGGARVAMQVALSTKIVAGVIASSAGYPDSQPRKSLPFAVFGTAGTEDFNYLELRMLDRALRSPHRVVIFEGGHTLPPSAVAVEAIEWLELQAMKSGRRAPDAALIDRLLETRRRAIAAAVAPVAQVHLLKNLVEDFRGLRDVSGETTRRAELSQQKDVKSALARERSDDDAEARILNDLFTLEMGLRDESRRPESLARLRDALSRSTRQADAAADSPERRRARRLLRAIAAGAGERVQDVEYLKLLEQYRRPAPVPPPH